MDPFEQAKALFLQALEHHNGNRFGPAEVLYRKALDLMPTRVSLLVNLAAVLASQQRPDEALVFCERALALEPGNPDARSIQAQCSRAEAGPAQALQMLDQAIAADPSNVEAHSNRGVLLRDLGRFSESLASYDRALALSPDHVGVLANRGSVLARLGRVSDALASYRQALRIDPGFAAAGEGFIHLVLDSGFAPADHDPEFDALLIRAIAEPWARPASVVPALTSALRSQSAVADLLARIDNTWPQRMPLSPALAAELTQVVHGNPVLAALLVHAVISDIAIERLLTTLRSWLLHEVATDPHADRWPDVVSTFNCALAMQCFTNEFVYETTADEGSMVLDLRKLLVDALDRDQPVPLPLLVAVASYLPLYTIPEPERLSARRWPAPVEAMLERLLGEPLQERHACERIVRITGVGNEVSRQVQQQYEENPYPRWMSLVPGRTRMPLQEYVRNRVPGSEYRTSHRGTEVAVLNAGCGTGQAPIDTALRLAGARVLAVDLSMASLCYGARMAAKLGIDTIRFAQGDLLELGSLDQRFDLIESTGVLHHLDDPAAGLQVLATLLRPGGIMRLALYSKSARRPVAAARALIARRGYTATAQDIRRCRSEIMALDDGAPEKRVTAFSDFYSMSECRDLLFHVREHELTLPEIKRMLDAAGLGLVGFELEPARYDAFARSFPDPAALTDFGAWQDYEERNPDTFAEMYRFWVCNEHDRRG